MTLLQNDGRVIWGKTADLPNGIEMKTLLTSRNAHGTVKNYFDKSIGKKGMKRLVIDNYESLYITDLCAVILDLIENEEYAAEFDWVTILDKSGNLIDVIRK